MPDKTTAIDRAAASLDRLTAALRTGDALDEYLEAACRDHGAALAAGATGADIHAARTPGPLPAAAVPAPHATPRDDCAQRAAALILSAIAAKLQVSEDDLALEAAVHAQDTVTMARVTATATTIDLDPDGSAEALEKRGLVRPSGAVLYKLTPAGSDERAAAVERAHARNVRRAEELLPKGEKFRRTASLPDAHSPLDAKAFPQEGVEERAAVSEWLVKVLAGGASHIIETGERELLVTFTADDVSVSYIPVTDKDGEKQAAPGEAVKPHPVLVKKFDTVKDVQEADRLALARADELLTHTAEYRITNTSTWEAGEAAHVLPREDAVRQLSHPLFNKPGYVMDLVGGRVEVRWLFGTARWEPAGRPTRPRSSRPGTVGRAVRDAVDQ